jgi:hypothetical protein
MMGEKWSSLNSAFFCPKNPNLNLDLPGHLLPKRKTRNKKERKKEKGIERKVERKKQENIP